MGRNILNVSNLLLVISQCSEVMEENITVHSNSFNRPALWSVQDFYAMVHYFQFRIILDYEIYYL